MNHAKFHEERQQLIGHDVCNYRLILAKNRRNRTLISPVAIRKTSSITQPTAMRAALAVCSSFHVVSESTPTPPHGRRTKLFRGSSAEKKRVLVRWTSSKDTQNLVDWILSQVVTQFVRVHPRTVCRVGSKKHGIRLGMACLDFFQGGFA